MQQPTEMATYRIKIRVFPPSKELHDGSWDTSDVSDWEWEYDDAYYRTEYARPVTSETGREGLSIRMLVSIDSDEEPDKWDWSEITGLRDSRIEFIAATKITDELDACYQCEKVILKSEGWLVKDDDYLFCSLECLHAYYDGDSAVATAPNGDTIVVNHEEEE